MDPPASRVDIEKRRRASEPGQPPVRAPTVAGRIQSLLDRESFGGVLGLRTPTATTTDRGPSSSRTPPNPTPPRCYEKILNQAVKTFLTKGVSLPRFQVSAAFLITSIWVG